MKNMFEGNSAGSLELTEHDHFQSLPDPNLDRGKSCIVIREQWILKWNFGESPMKLPSLGEERDKVKCNSNPDCLIREDVVQHHLCICAWQLRESSSWLEIYGQEMGVRIRFRRGEQSRVAHLMILWIRMIFVMLMWSVFEYAILLWHRMSQRMKFETPSIREEEGKTTKYDRFISYPSIFDPLKSTSWVSAISKVVLSSSGRKMCPKSAFQPV